MIEKLREELIKDIISYLDKVIPHYVSDENNAVHMDVTQIIVDSFDEYEYDTQQDRLYTEDIKAQDRELNKKCTSYAYLWLKLTFLRSKI